MARAAIVIGVNRTTGLAELTAAASDASKFAHWIAKQGFEEPKVFTDEGGGKVRFSEIFGEVSRIVERNAHTQLVIYFSGHGFQSVQSEVWLLSDAPQNPAEAIALEPSIAAARESGLVSVVFISDACRSIPNTLEYMRVTGASIFPSKPLNRRQRPDVDRFFATLPSLVAVEAAKANDEARRGGVFTQELISVHRNPPTKSVVRVREGAQDVEVVTTRALRPLVRDSVEDAVYAIAPAAGQLPDAIIESVDAYIGHVDRAAPTVVAHNAAEEFEIQLDDAEGTEEGGGGRGGRVPHGPVRPPAKPRRARSISVAEFARDAVGASVKQSPPRLLRQARAVGEAVGWSDATTLYMSRGATDHFESDTGFAITGTTVKEAWSRPLKPELLGDALVRIGNTRPKALAGSLLIRFAEDTGTVLPWLRDFVGHVFIKDGLVTNVNYVPSTGSPRWHGYNRVMPQLESLRAAVATAAGLGVFRIDRADAGKFADKIRVLKGVDPTLGVYAAYAYAGAGMKNDVARYMRSDLRVDLFDVAMLDRRGVKRAARPKIVGTPIVPFCPILWQGWALMPVRHASVPPIVQRAQQWLLPSLWTTFAPEGVELLSDAISKGRLS
jgi:Caspase domain